MAEQDVTAGDAISITDAVLVEVGDWLKRGEQLRRLLIDERDGHMRRVHEIDRALAVMPGEPPPIVTPPGFMPSAKAIEQAFALNTSPKSRSGLRSLRRAKVPQIVRAILSEHPEGVSTGFVISAAQEIKPGVDPGLVSAALYRAPGIRKQGPKGAMLYSLDDSEDSSAK